jgi:quinolinate synthase
MKSITLESVLTTLERQPPELEVTVPPEIAAKARGAIEKMFKLAEE